MPHRIRGRPLSGSAAARFQFCWVLVLPSDKQLAFSWLAADAVEGVRIQITV